MASRLTILLAASFLIRLIGLNQSLWLDEAVSANVVGSYSYQEIISKFSPNDFHPPLYYLTLKAWSGVWGDSETGLRMLSVISAMVTIAVVYLIGKKQKGEEAGWWAAAILAVNPLFVYYSQEARMYAWATMLLTLAIWALLEKKYWLYNLFSGLALLSFYGSAYLIASIGLYLLLKKDFRKFILTNWGATVAIILAYPLLTAQLRNSQLVLTQVANWSEVLGKANIKNIGLIGVKLVTGRINFYPKWAYWLLAGISSALVWLTVLVKGQKNKFWLFLVLAPLLLATGLSVKLPMMQYFRFLYLLPLVAMILATAKWRGWLLILMAVFSATYLTNPRFYREDWKAAAKSLEGEVVMIASVSDPVKYYSPKTEIVDLGEFFGGEREVTLIPYASEIHGINYRAAMEKMGYFKTGENDYRGVVVEQWEAGN
jgi:uncharacterized membrane protein